MRIQNEVFPLACMKLIVCVFEHVYVYICVYGGVVNVYLKEYNLRINASLGVLQYGCA